MKKKLRKNKRIYIFIFMLVSALLIFLFFHKKEQNEQRDTFVVQKQDVAEKLRFAGIIDAERRADLGFAIGGRVIKNRVKEGSFVKKGQMLAEVDQSMTKSGLIQAKANYDLSKLSEYKNLENFKKEYEKTKNEQDIIVKNFKKQYLSGDLKVYLVGEHALTKEIIAPRLTGNYRGIEEGKIIIEPYRSHSDTKYSYDYSGLSSGTATAEIKQEGKMGDTGLYLQFDPHTRYEYTTWEIPIPNPHSATYLARKSAYENALVKRDKILKDIQDKIDTLIEKEGGASLFDTKIKAAKSQLDAQYIRFADGIIRAPFSGYVVKNNLEKGETVQGLVPHITIFANKKKKLVLNTPEIYVNKIKVGDDVEVVLDAYPDKTFHGKIRKIDEVQSIVDGVPVYETEVILDDDTNNIARVGMNAHASITTEEKKAVLAIPKHFIVQEKGKSFVYIFDNDGKEIKREVKTGMEGNDGLVEILSGLFEGDTIIYKNNDEK